MRLINSFPSRIPGGPTIDNFSPKNTNVIATFRHYKSEPFSRHFSPDSLSTMDACSTLVCTHFNEDPQSPRLSQSPSPNPAFNNNHNNEAVHPPQQPLPTHPNSCQCATPPSVIHPPKNLSRWESLLTHCEGCRALLKK